MPRQLALLLCVGFIVWLFRTDRKWRRASLALWIPGIWLVIIGSRPVSLWLGGVGSGTTSVEGNPINMAVQGALMLAALLVLQRRGFNWQTFIRDNRALVAIYLYFALTALWSYFPFVSFKRVCKDFGTVLMVLVILTEDNPFAAARLLFVRVSYLLLPLSVLFIKYYPEYGRMYDRSYHLMYTGVTTNKNALGIIVLIYGMFLVFDTMVLHRNREMRSRKKVLGIHYLLLFMGSWLLYMSHSKTSLVCAILGGIALWSSRYLSKLRSPGRIAATCVAVVLTLAAIDSTFGLSDTIIHALGRKENLTGRTEIWSWIVRQPVNPIIGCGFMAFWDGPLGQAYNEEHLQTFQNSQNGYLDVYLDGGMIAILLLAWLLASSGKKVFESLPSGSLFSRAMFVLFIIALVHDYSETSFFEIDSIWFTCVLTVVASASFRKPVLSCAMKQDRETSGLEAPEATT